MAVAILAGGCFWCMEAAFSRLNGVRSVQSGYIGGHLADPDYHRVCAGDTGHAEAVRVEFDPELIGYRTLLDVFFTLHDPTSLNRQGDDVGTQYRSALFPLDEAQASTARAMLEELATSGRYDSPIVTAIEPASTFYPAEAYHERYYERNGSAPYCAYVIAPKLGKLDQHFSSLLEHR